MWYLYQRLKQRLHQGYLLVVMLVFDHLNPVADLQSLHYQEHLHRFVDGVYLLYILYLDLMS